VVAEASSLPTFSQWLEGESFIVCLESKSLDKLKDKLLSRGIEFTSFYEPDINKETAIAFFDKRRSRVVSSLPLAGNGDKNDT
jgi:hypothetical protein